MKIVTAITGVAAACAIGSSLIGPATADPAGTCVFNFADGRPYPQHGAVIVGGEVDCPVKPDMLHTDLQIMFRVNGRWAGRNAANSSQPPNPRLNLATYAQCEPGAWIGMADLWEDTAGRSTHMRFTSTTVIISAEECRHK